MNAMPGQQKATALLQSSSDDWAPSYNFSDTEKEWRKQLEDYKDPTRTFKHKEFYEHAGFQDYENVEALLGELYFEDSLTGLLFLRRTAKEIGLAPVKPAYSQEEVDFIVDQIINIANTIKIKFEIQNEAFYWIPHQLRDISPEEAQENEKNLKSFNSSHPKRNEILKKVLYSAVPWRKLEALGKFCCSLVDRKKRYTNDERAIFEAVVPELIKDFRTLTESFAHIIRYHQHEKKKNTGDIKWEFFASPPFSVVESLGSFVRDKDSLGRMENALKSLQDADEEELQRSSKKIRYAVLRILNILGECGIFLSSSFKRILAEGNSWTAFKNIRNAFHDFRKQTQLHERVLNITDDIFLRKILEDLRNLYANIQTSRLFPDDITWPTVSLFYSSPRSNQSQPVRATAVIDLNAGINGPLKLDEETERVRMTDELSRATDELFRATDDYYEAQEVHKTALEKLLLQDKIIDRNQPAKFHGPFPHIALAEKMKKKLKTFYIKRWNNEKDGKDSVLQEKDEERVKEIFATLAENKKALKTLIKNTKENNGKQHKEKDKELAKSLYNFAKWEDLEIELSGFGIQSGVFLDLWKKLFNDYKTQEKIERIKHLSNKIQETIKTFGNLFDEYRKICPSERLIEYQNDSLISLAAEYLISSFRQQAQDLWNSLSILNNEKNQELIAQTYIALKRAIDRAKIILHNHDVTEISTLTPLGRDFCIIVNDIPYLLGEWFDLEFYIANSNFTIPHPDGKKILKIPVIDKRAIAEEGDPSVKKCITGSKEFLDRFPHVLLDDEKAAAETELNKLQENSQELKEIYANITVRERFLLYTPPPKKTDNLLGLLQSLCVLEWSSLDANSSPQPLASHICTDKNGAETQWQEYSVPSDNECSLKCLGISRQEAMKSLWDSVGDDEIRKLVAPEISHTFEVDQIPFEMRNQEFCRLCYDCGKAHLALEKACKEANTILGTNGIRAEEILGQHANSTDPAIIELKSAYNFHIQMTQKVRDYAEKKETYEKFVHYYVGREGKWLGYIEVNETKTCASTLDALARLKEIHFKISHRKQETAEKLTLFHTFPGGNNKTVHMYWTHKNGLAHCNILKAKI